MEIGDVAAPRIVSVGTANPPDVYTQDQVLALYRCADPSITRFFRSSHIKTRRLALPKPDESGAMPDEDGQKLLEKHLRYSLDVGSEAIRKCLSGANLRPEDVDYLVVVSSTGFLCPSLSARLCAAMGFRRDAQRADLVGMGCNAGINGLQSAVRFADAFPGKYALLLACEICSAAYVFDQTRRTGVVNSLFGDGAAAVLAVRDDRRTTVDGPRVLGFETFLVDEAMEEMRFDFEKGRFSFYLGRDVPYTIGENVRRPVDALLARAGLKQRQVTHWLVHAGGKKVIDSVKYNLGLTDRDMRHTRSILQRFGNISSASVFFSYQELMREGSAKEGDWGVAIAMGPGATIETALLRW